MSAYCCIWFGFLLTLNYDARNHEFKIIRKIVCCWGYRGCCKECPISSFIYAADKSSGDFWSIELLWILVWETFLSKWKYYQKTGRNLRNWGLIFYYVFLFRYNRIMCVLNRIYICSRYKQHYHHQHYRKYTSFDTRIFYRYITGNNSMGALSNSLIFRYSFMHACVHHLLKKSFKK